MHSFPGFCRLRMHTKGGSPVAFIEYQDVRYAAQAMATLQGSLLVSSDRGAIRIEYAKSKMAEVGFTNIWIEVGSTHSLQSTISSMGFFPFFGSVQCRVQLQYCIHSNIPTLANFKRAHYLSASFFYFFLTAALRILIFYEKLED